MLIILKIKPFMKATWDFFHKVLFIKFYEVFLTFRSVD